MLPQSIFPCSETSECVFLYPWLRVSCSGSSERLFGIFFKCWILRTCKGKGFWDMLLSCPGRQIKHTLNHLNKLTPYSCLYIQAEPTVTDLVTGGPSQPLSHRSQVVCRQAGFDGAADVKRSSQHLRISGVSGRKEVVLTEFTHVHLVCTHTRNRCTWNSEV